MAEYTTIAAQAEGIIIKSLCDSEMKIKLNLLSKLRKEHFGLYATQQIFTRITTLIENNKDIPSVDIFRVDPALPDDCKAYINNLQQSPVTCLEDANQLFEFLEKYRAVRTLMIGAENILSSIKVEDPDIDKIVTDLESNILNIKSKSVDTVILHSGVGDNLDSILDDMTSNNESDLIQTGFKTFDKLSGGFERTGLVILSSTPGGGKSTMAIQLGINMSLIFKYNVCLVSLEMNKKQCWNRYISNITQTPYTLIRTRKLSRDQKEGLRKKYHLHKEKLKENKARFSVLVPESNFSLAQYEMMLKPYKYDVIMFDYINLLSRDENYNMANWEKLMDHSKNGKQMARNMNTLIIMLAQLNEATGKIKYAQAINENCDNWWKWLRGDKEIESHLIEVEQGKARDSITFNFTLLENFEYMTLQDTGSGEMTYRQKQDGYTPVPSMIGLDEDENEL